MPSLLISKSKLFSNLALLRDNIPMQIACVIKDNAYGHGLDEIGTLLEEFGIESVFVKNNAEADRIKDRFKHITILYPSAFENIASNVYLSVSSMDCLSKITPNTGIELKVNTGMNRNGIEPDELQEALNLVAQRGIRLIGVFTHNGYGDSKNLCEDFIPQQEAWKALKQKVLDFIDTHKMPLPRFHSLSSSGALKYKNADDDLARIGIAMYGYLGIDDWLGLEPIAELWANKISSRFLHKGSKIGYDGAYTVGCDCTVSSYDIGYGDGLFRLSENHAEMRTKEGFLVLPRMSMDSTSIISSEDRICIMHDANALASIFGTISHEVLCRLSPSIKREIVP